MENKEKPKTTTAARGGGSYKDAKRTAISLGMPFEQAVLADYYELSSFSNKSTNKPDISLIAKYDEWVDKQLLERGYQPGDPMLAYEIKLAYLGEGPHGDPEIPQPIKKLRKKMGASVVPVKERISRDSFGFYSGTKKSYTFELASKGFSLERIIRRVTKRFPDSKPKSIKQWVNVYYRNFVKDHNTGTV